MASNSPGGRQRPLSPNMQLYRPQLTSVLSIVNRLTGILLSIAAIALVIWLAAGAAGPQTGVRDGKPEKVDGSTGACV